MLVTNYDVIVVGAGPAGLSAALMLGRCCLRVVVFDDGRPRNTVASASHGFLTRDGESPRELLRRGREELSRYGIPVREMSVVDAQRTECGFELVLANGEHVSTRKLILATGRKDHLPRVEGFDALYGKGIWSCPFCDAWEHRGQKFAALGSGKDGVDLAIMLRSWSDDVILVTHGISLSWAHKERLARMSIEARTAPIARFTGAQAFDGILFDDGSALARDALFFHLGATQASHLPAKLGCHFDKNGAVKTVSKGEETGVAGLYVVGDASRDALMISVAVAEGAKAACHASRALAHEREVQRS